LAEAFIWALAGFLPQTYILSEIAIYRQLNKQAEWEQD